MSSLLYKLIQKVNRKYLQGGLQAIVFLHWRLFGGGGHLVRHHAPPTVGNKVIQRDANVSEWDSAKEPPVSPVQHLGGGPLQLLQDLQQLRVVVTEAPPAQHAGQVVPGAQRQHAELALRGGERDSPSASPSSLTPPPPPLTCLWRLSLSSSDSTQPTLPSPPHTRIRKVTNFWKSRSLVERGGVGAISLLVR